MRWKILVLFAAVSVLVAGAAKAAWNLDDAVTHVKVRTALLEKFGTDALGVRIEVNAGRVVLTGSVDQPSTRDLAREVALSVRGVHDVESRISLGAGPAAEARSAASHSESKLKDALLEMKVKGALLGQVGENAMKIEVEVSDGVVSLRGIVPNGGVRDSAIDTARSTGGVRRVVNLLTVG